MRKMIMVLLVLMVWIMMIAEVAKADEALANVKALLEKYPNIINRPDSYGETLLHWSARKGYKDVVEFLISKGADVNAETRLGQTPLHLAAANGHRAVVELLIYKGANVNVIDGEFCSTALHGAARNGYKDMVELLIANGADINLKTIDGKTPLQLAKELGRNEIVEILSKHNQANLEVPARPKSLQELKATFGDFNSLKDKTKADKVMIRLTLPSIQCSIGGGKVRTLTIDCHQKIAPLIKAVFDDIQNQGLVKEIHSYDGCYNFRYKRGSSTELSIHSWGMAIDLNAQEHPMGSTKQTEGQRKLAKIFEQHGFYQLPKDPMHFQYCAEFETATQLDFNKAREMVKQAFPDYRFPTVEDDLRGYRGSPLAPEMFRATGDYDGDGQTDYVFVVIRKLSPKEYRECNIIAVLSSRMCPQFVNERNKPIFSREVHTIPKGTEIRYIYEIVQRVRIYKTLILPQDALECLPAATVILLNDNNTGRWQDYWLTD